MPLIRDRVALGRLLAAVTAAVTLGGLASCTTPTDPDPEPDPTPSASSTREAERQLEELAVREPGSMRGYSRKRFPHWDRTGANCDVRDSVLQRDGRNVRLDGCNVVGGEWFSVYDNLTLTDPSEVDIDHVVPLANAWRSGAASWNDEQRGEFANDLTRPQLIAVSRTSNRAKGDQDPSQWKPPNRDYWCQYAEDWIAVKHHWQLSVTSAEKAALSDMLETCP